MDNQAIINEIPQEYFFIIFRVLLDRRGNPTRVSLQIDSDIKMVMQKDNFLEVMKSRCDNELYQQITRSIMCIGDFFLINATKRTVTEISRYDVDKRLTATEINRMVKEDEKLRKEQDTRNLVVPALDKPFNNLDIPNRKSDVSVKPRIFTQR